MFRLAVALACLFAVSGFQQSARARQALSLSAKSKSLPFLDAPDKLDGSMVGDVGFDPLGISNTVADLEYVRAAELKHGRVAMLATVGFLLAPSIHFIPVDDANPFAVIKELGLGPNLQVLAFIACLELASWKMTFEPTGKPGDYGFDPANLSKKYDDKKMTEMKTKEIKNGRLAMIGIIGMMVEKSMFGHLAVSG